MSEHPHSSAGGVHGDPATMVHVEDHLADCLALVSALPPVEVPLLAALDRLLAEDVVAPAPLPGADNSAMDGYAVRCVDVAGAGPQRPVLLPVVADLPAGVVLDGPLPPGAAVRIMTGGVVPEGADGIVPVEHSDGGVQQVRLTAPAEPGRFVRRAGEDVAAGETVLRAGERLDPRRLALAAAVGRARLRVRPAPRVVVLTTGDEVVEPGLPLQPGQVHDSNGVGVTAAALELGCDAVRVPAAGDDPARFRAVLDEQLARADVVVTTGGVSAGAFDVVKAALRGGGDVEFRKVAVQPGMPQGLGVLGGSDGRRVPLYCLPGNPVSAMVSFEVFVRPVLRTLLGERHVHRPLVPAVVATGWRAPVGRRQYARVVLRDDPERPGSHLCEPVGGQGSHLVADLADAHALAVVPEHVTDVAPGQVLDCLLLQRVRR